MSRPGFKAKRNFVLVSHADRARDLVMDSSPSIHRPFSDPPVGTVKLEKGYLSVA